MGSRPEFVRCRQFKNTCIRLNLNHDLLTLSPAGEKKTTTIRDESKIKVLQYKNVCEDKMVLIFTALFSYLSDTHLNQNQSHFNRKCLQNTRREYFEATCITTNL